MGARFLDREKRLPFYIDDNDDKFDSYGICNFKNSTSVTNLKKISIRTTLKEKLKEYPKNYNFKLFYEDVEMKKVKSLGKGSYGQVFLYLCYYKDKVRSVVIKKPLKKADPFEEPNIIDDYLQNTKICNHNVIPIRTILDQHKNPFIIMQTANGIVLDIAEKMDKRLKIKFIKHITKIVECFYNQGYTYLDLKLENILYKCDGNAIEFFLGDIGSFEKLGTENYVSTFTPPELKLSKNAKTNKASILYVLGVTIADLYDLTSGLYNLPSSDDSDKKRKMNKIFKNFYERVENSDIPENIKDVILALTKFNPKERSRVSFEYIYEKLTLNKKKSF
jgi:serine/threonine protein kinase